MAENVPTSLVGVVLCISRAISKCCLCDTSELENFSKQLCRNWTVRPERGFTDGFEVKDGSV